MNRFLLIILYLLLTVQLTVYGQDANDNLLANTILQDQSLDTVERSALKLLTGFSAGTSYNEIWIRDFNTFINGSLKVHKKELVKEMLLLFFKIQATDGNIVDGLVDTSKANVGYPYRYSPLLPTWAAHKNTVETDQESSLIQAVKKYVTQTRDYSVLAENIDGKKVVNRMEAALNYVLADRWSPKYGLVKGATTIDWGDVQPEKGWGVAINNNTKWAIDIYDNAMFSIAIQDFLMLIPKDYKATRDWSAVVRQIRVNVRKHLWSVKDQKYKPHLYLTDSPFSSSFSEGKILYSGGSICAIQAGFNTVEEVKNIIKQLREAAAKEKFATIGMTVYPPYPKEAYPNMLPYQYQNGGDWTWFGGRIVPALLPYDLIGAAYEDLKPMITRVIKNKGFYEWYNVQTGEPKGSGDFRGEAGILYDAISTLKQWAMQNRKAHLNNRYLPP